MALEDAKSKVDTAFTRSGPRGYAFENAFGGAASFRRRPYTKDPTGVDHAIAGAPFDQAVTHCTGSRRSRRAALREMAGINMVGRVVVEVSPPSDTAGATAIAAAHVAYELVCLYHWARKQR